MRISPNTLKWTMRFYPPFLLQRIWVQRVLKDFRGIDVKINRSLVTTNLGKSTFGGTIFSATDPFYALLFNQLVIREGIDPIVWLKSARITYLKPARTDLYFKLRISDSLLEEALTSLRNNGKFVKELPIEVYDKDGDLCVLAFNEVYVRDKAFSTSL